MCARPLWTLLFLCTAARLSAQDPLFHRFTLRDGLPSNRIYTIAQDADGFIWFGSDAGVARFDGTHIDRYDVSNGLSDDDVFVVTTDARGRLWFLPANGRPCYMDRGGLHSWRTDTALARIEVPSGIRSMQEDRTGTLWFGGLKGELATLTSDGHARMRILADPVTHHVGGHITIGSDLDDRIQVFSNARHLPLDVDASPWHDDTVTEQNVTRSFPGGHILCTTTTRVMEWREGAWKVLLSNAEMAVPGAFQQAFMLGDDELWVTLWDGGVLWLRKENGRWRHVRAPLFQSDLINNVLRDREGNIWLCTAYGGVIMFTERAIGSAYYRGQRGGHEEFLRAHATTTEGGGIWCGTNQGDLYHLGEHLELVDLPPAGAVFSRLSAIRSHGPIVWAATDRHLFRIHYDEKSGRVLEIRSIPSIASDHSRFAGLKSIAVGADGRLVGSMYGLMELDTTTGVMQRLLYPGIPDLRIYAPHIDARGTVWYEEQGKLFSLTRNELKQHTDLALSTGTRITDLTSIGDTLVIATGGEGLLFHVGDRVVQRVTTADGLSSDHVHHLFSQGGEVFVTTQEGADRVSGPWSAPRVQRYAMTIGTQPQSVRDVVADSAFAYILFADGLCRMPRTEDAPAASMPTPYFRTVLVNDSAMADRSIVGLRQGRDRLTVELGAVHFATPGQVLLEYRLDPTDHWQRSTGSTLELTNLGAGDHLLQVRAALIDGVWSAPAVLTVIVRPPWWARWWARAIMVLTALSLAYVVLRTIAYRRLRRQEERVRQREGVAQERQRIAMDLHDDLGAELSSLLLLTRMERERPGLGASDQVEQLVSNLTEKIKEVIWSTDPGHDTLEATLSFIQHRVGILCARHGLLLRTAIDPLLPALELNAGTRREVFLIAKEAANNAVKHAGARTFTIGAHLDADAVVLTFTDDGIGGTTRAPQADGQGLRNMAQRAAALWATLEVSEVEPHGTRITLRTPVPTYHQSV